MPSNAPAVSRDRSPAFSEVFAAGAGPVSLTNRVPVPSTGGVYGVSPGTAAVAPYQNASSGAVAIATATSMTISWKDCTGVTRTTGALTVVVGQSFPLPFAMTELTLNTGAVVVVYWHGGSSNLNTLG